MVGGRGSLTLSVSISLLMTSLTRLGRSSAHWQYSITIFTSSGTILERREGEARRERGGALCSGCK